MKELNIARSLISKRHEKGITQDELASFIGVSKASVSKWETGQSYPDITFLPQLASYFNISVDELLGYEPQMLKEDIRKLYLRLSSDFACKPFDEVYAECRQIIRKYFSCYPLLLQMAGLLINHGNLAFGFDAQKDVINEAVSLCSRIRAESGDVWLTRDATCLEATGYLFLQKPQAILDLLGETIRPLGTEGELLSQAYQLLGNKDKAAEVTQIHMYQHLLMLAGATPAYLMLNSDNEDKFEAILLRALSLSDIFELENLHPNTMAQIYYISAQIYCMKNNADKALNMLQKYATLCTTRFFPFTLHGDAYFDMIDSWFSNFELGASPPRSEKLIKESMLQGILQNPAFTVLSDQPLYKNILLSLKNNLEDN